MWGFSLTGDRCLGDRWRVSGLLRRLLRLARRAVLADVFRARRAARDQIDLAAGLLDLGARRRGDRVGLDDDALLQLAVAEHLEQVRLLLLRGQAAREHRLQVDDRAVVEHLEVADIDDGEDLLEDLVVDPDLRHAPVERHLAPLPAELARPAGARLRALVATARGLAESRADAAAEPLA